MGSTKLEEVWVKYRADRRFNLKMGMLIPIFNNLNEINNRTALLSESAPAQDWLKEEEEEAWLHLQPGTSS